jgi:competence protein ComEA
VEQINQILNTHKLPILLSFVGIVLILGGVFSSGILNKPKAAAVSFPKKSIVSTTSPQEVKVDISGALINPGVYSLPLNSRVEDAVKAAGGFSEKANSEFISKSLNLSQKVSDGMKIYVPSEGEAAITVSGGSSVAGVSTQMIDLNSASESDLDGLPGVGPVTAQKIIDGRPYSAVEDLQTKKIVSASVFEKIKDKINAN